jgi:hypothetical protein
MDEGEREEQSGAKGRAKGGRARAERLSPAERREIARRAAGSRWHHDVSAAVSGSPDQPLRIGDAEIECYVLDDGTRVLTQASFLRALGRHPKANTRREGGDTPIPPILQSKALSSFITDDILDKARPITFRPPAGGRAYGYNAELLPVVCEIYLRARDEGVLDRQQEHVAERAEILIRGLARVGIIALVDEATGYQDVRARQELQKILEAYVQEQFRPWLRAFPDEFFRETYRIHGWEFRPGQTRRNPGVGKLIKHYIYGQLPQGVLAELERLNPRNEKWNRPRKHHQHLTESTGNVHLDRQINAVITLMKISRNRAEFDEYFERAFPPPQQKLPLEIDVYEASKESRKNSAEASS